MKREQQLSPPGNCRKFFIQSQADMNEKTQAIDSRRQPQGKSHACIRPMGVMTDGKEAAHDLVEWWRQGPRPWTGPGNPMRAGSDGPILFLAVAEHAEVRRVNIAQRL